MNLGIFLYAITAIITAQISNIVMVKFNSDFFKLMQIVAIFQIIIGFFLIKYFSIGTQMQIKYALLALFYYGLSIVLALLIQYVIFSKPLTINEITSILLIITGIIFYFIPKITAS